MFVMGIGLLYYYFKLSLKFHINIKHSDNESILLFIITRIAAGILFPLFAFTILIKLVFSLFNLDFNSSGYMSTEYFIVINILCITTLGLLVYYFYEHYRILKVTGSHKVLPALNDLVSNSAFSQIEKSHNTTIGSENGNQFFTSIELKREFAELELNVVVLKINKESTIIFKRNGTCESYDNRDIINELKNSVFMLQCNRWVWINMFYIQGIIKKGNQEYLSLKDDLEEKFSHLKSFNEGFISNTNKRQSYLFISRSFKENVYQELKSYK